MKSNIARVDGFCKLPTPVLEQTYLGADGVTDKGQGAAVERVLQLVGSKHCLTLEH